MNKLFLVRDIIGLSLLPSPPFPPLRSRFVSKKPPSPIPRIPPKVASKRATKTPEPRINSRIFLFVKAQGDGASNSPHHLKVANPSASVPHTLSGGNGACAVGGMIMPPNGVQGQRPWHAFGSFRRETKGTRGRGAERPLWGAGAKSDDLLPRGASPSQRQARAAGRSARIRGRRDPRPCKIPRGAGLKRSRNRKKVVAKKANLYDNKGEPK